MGRVKLAIKKIETTVGKQVTYSKRKAGLEKKAKELATLCDIDLLLLLFSPAGKLSWINGSKSAPEEVLMRFANLSPQERAKRKVEALEQLKRTFKKLDHEVDVEELARQNTTPQNVEELNMYLQNIQIESLHLQQKLRAYESFQTLEEGVKLEEFLQSRIQDVQAQKQLLESSQCMVPHGPTVGQQVYTEGVVNSGVLDSTAQGSWEADHTSQAILAHPLSSNSLYHSRDPNHATTGLQSNEIQFGKQIGVTHLFTGLKQLEDREKLRIEMDAICSNSVEYVEEHPSSLGNSLLERNGLSLHWPTNSNPMSSNTVMSAMQRTKAHYFQQLPFESEELKQSNMEQEEHFRSQSISGLAREMEWQR